MEIIEKQMKQFGGIIQEQGKKIENAEYEVDKLKATIQKQEAEMKFMENKLEKYETIVIGQRNHLNDKERNIQDLERALINQDKEIDRIKDEIITMKGSMHTEDFQIAVQEKTNGYRERKIEKTRNEGNRKSDLITSFKNVPEQQSTDSSNSTTESSIEIPNSPSDQVSAEFIGTNNKEYKDKGRLEEIVSLKHQSQRKQERQISSRVAFSAYLSKYVGGLGNGHTIKCDQVLLNDRNAYSPYSGTLTVPETGVYLLTFEPCSEKTGLRGFRPGQTQTGLYSFRK